MELKGKKVNFLGDSITEGHGVENKENLFTVLIKEQYGLAESRNYGIGGTRFARQSDAEPQQDSSFCKRLFDMDRDADIVVVFGGTNDFGHGDAPLGSFDDRTPDTFYGACHYILSNLMTLYPKAQLALLTPLHRGNENCLTGDRKPQEAGVLADYVSIIKEVAAYYSVPVLDLFTTAGIQPAVEVNRLTYIPDGLHPNDEGHKLLARKIGNFLCSL